MRIQTLTRVMVAECECNLTFPRSVSHGYALDFFILDGRTRSLAATDD